MHLFKILSVCCLMGTLSIAQAFGETEQQVEISVPEQQQEFVGTEELPEISISEQQEKDAFHAADENLDIQLNFVEFRSFISTMAKLGNKKAKMANSLGYLTLKIGFGRGDRDGDGQLTPDELRTLR